MLAEAHPHPQHAHTTLVIILRNRRENTCCAFQINRDLWLANVHWRGRAADDPGGHEKPASPKSAVQFNVAMLFFNFYLFCLFCHFRSPTLQITGTSSFVFSILIFNGGKKALHMLKKNIFDILSRNYTYLNRAQWHQGHRNVCNLSVKTKLQSVSLEIWCTEIISGRRGSSPVIMLKGQF